MAVWSFIVPLAVNVIAFTLIASRASVVSWICCTGRPIALAAGVWGPGLNGPTAHVTAPAPNILTFVVYGVGTGMSLAFAGSVNVPSIHPDGLGVDGSRMGAGPLSSPITPRSVSAARSIATNPPTSPPWVELTYRRFTLSATNSSPPRNPSTGSVTLPTTLLIPASMMRRSGASSSTT